MFTVAFWLGIHYTTASFDVDLCGVLCICYRPFWLWSPSLAKVVCSLLPVPLLASLT